MIFSHLYYLFRKQLAGEINAPRHCLSPIVEVSLSPIVEVIEKKNSI